ncbi:MFS transporter [Leucobacter sp. CSA2]|uniref:MFS transporter n=1 Tax=Leucobacter edaphi TaxID=2796472 RepID=A0A934UXN0_9MICO|nr:MFS transporter [Leucobacter edaphi]MBK0421791.1 MFS transporter [Leucobacter edaphi]
MSDLPASPTPTSPEGSGADAATAATPGHPATGAFSAPAAPLEPAKKRTIFAWSLWDWGSAAFQAVVTTFVFTVYLTSGAFGEEAEVSVKLGFALTIAGVTIALLAPVLGKITDATGNRKHWLAITTGITVACTALLVLVAPEPQYLILGLILLAIGNIAFEFAGVSYNSMLNQLATPATLGRISGFGWGMGYLGGIVLLSLVLVGFILPETGWFGVTSEGAWNVRVAMVLCAVWFAVFAIPVFVAVPEVPANENSRVTGLLSGYAELFRSIAGLWRGSRSTLFFLISSAVFRDGLAGVFTFAGIIAARSFDFAPQTIIVFAIVANVVSGAATIIGGFLEDRFTAKGVIITSLAAMVIGMLLVFMLAPLGPWVFWTFGLLSSIFVGPVQAASRSYLAARIPAGMEGEIFGLYATTGRAVSFLAPAAFTAAVALGGTTISGTIGIALVLLLGLVLLLVLRDRRPAASLQAGPASAA